MRVSEFLTHPFKPFFDKDSKILILGSFPSVNQEKMDFTTSTQEIVFGLY